MAHMIPDSRTQKVRFDCPILPFLILRLQEYSLFQNGRAEWTVRICLEVLAWNI